MSSTTLTFGNDVTAVGDKMPQPQNKNISISRLHLDLHNPRLGHHTVVSEDEALARLLQEFGSEIFYLAKSIASKGLDPTQMWAVVKENNKFVVLEGNRRLAACRLLADPHKAPTVEWQKKFRLVREHMSADDSYKRPLCHIFQERKDARYWIQIKHHGKGKGEGVASWGPEMVYLNKRTNGGEAVDWNEFWYWLERVYSGDIEIHDAVENAMRKQYTSMERVYPEIKELFKASLTPDGNIEVLADPSAVRSFVLALMKGMVKSSGDKDNDSSMVVNSRTLGDRDSAARVLSSLWRETVSKEYSVYSQAKTVSDSKEATRTVDAKDSQLPTHTALPTATVVQSQTSQDRKNSNARRKSETHLFGGVHTGNLPQRLKDMLKECKSLKIENYPEVCSVLARVCLELAVQVLIDKRNINRKGKKELKDLVALALKHIEPNINAKDCPNKELVGTWSAIQTDTEQGHAIKYLNECVHSYEFTSAGFSALQSNKIFTPLINAINTELKRKK